MYVIVSQSRNATVDVLSPTLPTGMKTDRGLIYITERRFSSQKRGSSTDYSERHLPVQLLHEVGHSIFTDVVSLVGVRLHFLVHIREGVFLNCSFIDNMNFDDEVRIGSATSFSTITKLHVQ